MNKIFKVVWSKVRNAYVVVSEIAKNTVSGVGKRNRVKRFSMGATLAAVALTSSFFASNYAEAADSAMVNANTTHYIAVGGASLDTNPFAGIEGVQTSAIDRFNKTITVTFNANDSDPKNDESYVYELKTINYKDINGNSQSATYWIREGFGVKAITERYHPDATQIRLDLYKIPGQKASYDHIAMTGEHVAEITSHYTAVNNVNLDNLVYIQYAGMTNSGGVDVPPNWQYYIKRGEDYVDVGGSTTNFYDNFYVFKENEYNEKTGKYTFAGNDVDYSNVYYVDNDVSDNIPGKIGVFLTDDYDGAFDNPDLLSGSIANAGIGVYGGTVFGKNNEILLSGYDSKTDTWTTVWAGEITDPNATIESMTLSEFNEILHHIHEEDAKLADAGIVSTKVTVGKDTQINTTLGAGTNVVMGSEIDLGLGDGKTKTITSAGSINMVNVAGKQVPGLYVVSSGGTKGNGDDTVITFIDSGAETSVDTNGNITTTQDERSKLTLKTGSVVVANDGATYVEGQNNVLNSLTINGKLYTVPTTNTEGTKTNNITIKNTGTNVNVSAITNETTGNTEYTINAVDTTYSLINNGKNTSTGSTTYDIKNNLTDKVIGSIVDTDTNTRYSISSSLNSKGENVYTFKEDGVALSTITDTNTKTTGVGLAYDASTQKLTLTLTDSDTEVVSGEVIIPAGSGNGNSVVDRYLVGAAVTTGEGSSAVTSYTGDYYVSEAGELQLNVHNGDGVTIKGIASTQALAKLEAKVNDGWVAQVDGQQVKKIGYSDILNFKSGSNVDVSINTDHSINISANDYRLVGNSITTTTTNDSGEEVTTTTYTGEYSVDDGGKVQLNVQNNIDGSISNVTIGNIATKTALDTISGNVNAGWEAQVNGNTAKVVTPGSNTLNFVAGNDNVTLSSEGNEIKISAKDTTYTVISSVRSNEDARNVVQKWAVNESGNQGNPIATIVDTDTVITGVNVANNKVTVTQNGGTQSSFDVQFTAGPNVNLTTDSTNKEIIISATDTKVVSGSVVDGTAGKYNINLQTDAANNNNITISNLHDYYTTNATVSDIGANGANVHFERNDNTNEYDLKFVGSGSATVSTDSSGNIVINTVDTNTVTNLVAGDNISFANNDPAIDLNGNKTYTVNATNYYVKAASVSNSNTDDKVTLTLEREDLPNIVIDDLKNTYTKNVAVTGSDNNASVQFRRNDNTSYGVTFTSGGGTTSNGASEDTYVQISDGTNNIKLNTGSVVRVNDDVSNNATNGDALEKLSVNGKVYSVATSASVEASRTEVKKSGTVINNTGISTPVVFTVTDATQNSDTHKTYEINVADMHVSDVQITDGANGALVGTVTMEDGVTADITGLHDYYTTGVTVINGSPNSAQLSFVRNNGTSYEGVTFVAGNSNVNITSDSTNKIITISANDTNEYIEGIVVDSAEVGKNKLTVQRSGSLADITGVELKDTTLKTGIVNPTTNGLKNTYVIEDTSEQKVTINDVASAEKVGGMFSAMQFKVTDKANGKIGLVGIDDNGVTKNYGEIPLTKTGGTNGEYVQIRIGDSTNGFALTTGSMVSANEGQTYVKNQSLTDITINDRTYNVATSASVEASRTEVKKSGTVINNTGISTPVVFTVDDVTQNSEAHKTYEINVADMHVDKVEISEGTKGALVGAVKMKDGTSATISGLHDYYATGLSIDATNKALTLTLNNGDAYSVGLDKLGTMNGWIANVGSTGISVNDADTINYVAGKNITLGAASNTDGGGNITVATQDTVDFQKITVGAVTIKENTGTTSNSYVQVGNVIIDSESGVSAGNKAIANVAAGVNDTDAVNVGQLKSVTNSEKHLVVNPADGSDGHYAVANDSVTLKVEGKDSSGITTYTDVVIDDVASARNLAAVKAHTIREFALTGGNGTGTINLIRENNSIVPGGLTFSSGGGVTVDTGNRDSEGKKIYEHPDTFITISNSDGSIILNTGSKVEANHNVSAGTEQLSSLRINGKDYIVPVFELKPDGTPVFQDYHIVNGTEDLYTRYTEDTDTNGNKVTISEVVEGYVVGDNGVVEMEVLDKHDRNKREGFVNIGNIATKSQQDINTKKLTGTVMYDAEGEGYNYNSIKLGEAGTSNYSNKTGGVKVTNVAYAVTDKNDTVNYDGSAAVNVDLLNDRIATVTTQATTAKTTLSETGKNITVGKTSNQDGSTNYTVNLNDNITLGDASKTNVNINGTNGSITALTTNDSGSTVTGKVEINSSTNTVTVGADNDTKVVINGANGSIAVGTQVTIDGTTGDIKAGSVQIDGDGTISGLTNTAWNANADYSNSNKAATEAQIQKAIQNVVSVDVAKAKTEVIAGNNVTVQSATATDGHTVYTISAFKNSNMSGTGWVDNTNDIQVKVNQTDGTNISSVEATIQDVAKASNLGNVSQLNDDLKQTDNNGAAIHTNVVQAVNKLDDKVNQGWNYTVNGVQAPEQNIKMGGTINFKDDAKNIELSAENGSIKVSMKDDVIFNKVTVGDVVVDSDGINAGNKKITNVAAGTEDNDAVNVKQLKEANAHASFNTQHIENLYGQDQLLDSRINQLGSKVNKVGAGAAALAALHPMDFDPDDKLSFAVGAGNYAGETATALGAFYRPNEKVMMNVAGTYGNGENMVNMGVSFALDRTNHVSNSRTAMAKEIVDLREQVATQGQQIAQLVALVQQLAGVQQPVVPAEQLFPDVPENHWAYEYINGLAAKGIIDGYPDGNFGGDRTMTRYEFAAMLFRAMEQGVVLSEQIRQEFEKELGRVRVDRVKGADNDPNKIERVRVNKAADRDNYGSKIVQVKH